MRHVRSWVTYRNSFNYVNQPYRIDKTSRIGKTCSQSVFISCESIFYGYEVSREEKRRSSCRTDHRFTRFRVCLCPSVYGHQKWVNKKKILNNRIAHWKLSRLCIIVYLVCVYARTVCVCVVCARVRAWCVRTCVLKYIYVHFSLWS